MKRLGMALLGLHFQQIDIQLFASPFILTGKLQHVGDVREHKTKCEPIRTRKLTDIAAVRLRSFFVGRNIRIVLLSSFVQVDRRRFRRTPLTFEIPSNLYQCLRFLKKVSAIVRCPLYRGFASFGQFFKNQFRQKLLRTS